MPDHLVVVFQLLQHHLYLAINLVERGCLLVLVFFTFFDLLLQGVDFLSDVFGHFLGALLLLCAFVVSLSDDFFDVVHLYLQVSGLVLELVNRHPGVYHILVVLISVSVNDLTVFIHHYFQFISDVDKLFGHLVNFFCQVFVLRLSDRLFCDD